MSEKITTAAKRVVKRAAPKIREAIIQHATDEVRQRLKSTGKSYERALRDPGAVKLTETGVTLTIKDPLVVAIEGGVDAYSIKERMLAKNAKTSKTGSLYVDVPITHDPSSVSPAIKSRITKTGRNAVTTPGKSFTRSLRIGGGVKKQAVQHTRGITDDMMKRGGAYQTVRRISTRSAPSAWWHPGFKGQFIMKKIAPRVLRSTIAILRTEFEAEGLKVKP